MQFESTMPDDNGTTIKSTKFTRVYLSAELEKLLNRLDLSPSILLEEDALAIDKNSSCSSGPGSIRNVDTEDGYPQQFSVQSQIDRNALLEEFEAVRAEGKIYVARNDFFHDQLGKHFKRKQMMRVYGEPNEVDPLKHKYQKKLLQYEQLREKLQAGEDCFKDDINLLREDFRKKMDEAEAAVEDLISEERAAGAQAHANGKPLPAKEIQALVTRELAKMKDISKIRVRYARLRDNLIEKEVVLDALNILTPNLDRKDYERLEAENFYYKHELKLKDNEIRKLAKKRGHIFRKLKAIQRKRNNLKRVILRRREISQELKMKIAKISQRRQIRRRKMKTVKKYFEKFEFILGLRMYPEVHTKMKDVEIEHKNCLKKIANIMKEIKEKDLCLEAFTADENSQELTETTDDEDSDENMSFRQKSRRPPLGGGFLQAL